MATTEDGIWTPDQIDDYNLVADLATMSSTVQDALERRANAYRGTSTQRNNFTSSAPEGTIWVDTNGDKEVWVKQGNTWQQIWPVVQGSVPGLPYATAAGVVTIPGGSGSRTSTQVDFPAGRFTVSPLVTMTYRGSATSGLEAGFGTYNISSTGFDAYMVRNSSTGAGFSWQAVQMTPTSAEG